MARTIDFKVSEKGAITVTGMRRFGITLYREEWERVTAEDFVASLQAFIDDHADQLSVKADKVSTSASKYALVK